MIIVSTKNSTGIIALAGSASFIGVGEDVSAYSSIKVTLRGTANAAGTLYLGFSSNNVVWTETEVVVTNPATQVSLTVARANTYFRARYVNGATSHASFRCQTIFTGDSAAPSVPGGGTANAQVHQVITITASNISTKSFAIANIPLNPAAFDFDPYGGIKQHYGVDFTISGTTVSWSGLGLDGFLAENDVIAVSYFV